MNPRPISSLQEPGLDLYKAISDAELLRTSGLFVAEGRLVVARVLADPRYRVHSCLLNQQSFDALRPALEAGVVEGPVFVCDTTAFAALTGFDFHRGCLALVHRPVAAPWPDLLGDNGVVVVLEGVTNADNVGGVFRNAAAFGVTAVLLSPGCCDPFYRKSIRTSMGAALRVPFARLEPWPDGLMELRRAGFQVAALSPREPSVTLETFALTARPRPRLALLVGTEGPGLTAEAERCADVRVRIPIAGLVDSLNLSVATGIALSRLAP